MSQIPLVSVITPVRNGEPFIREAIESVRDQGVPLQHIVVDDGSEDGSAAIAEAYGLTVVRRPRAGVAAALNAGLALATAAFTAFIDADDIWCPNKLRSQLALFDADPQLDMVFGFYTEFASHQAAAEPSRWRVRAEAQPGYAGGGILIRTNMCRRAEGFDEELVLGAFIDLVARARAIGAREQLTNDVVFRRRVHGANLTIVSSGNRHDYLRVARAELARRRNAPPNNT